jgi:hypothetical protein
VNVHGATERIQHVGWNDQAISSYDCRVSTCGSNPVSNVCASEIRGLPKIKALHRSETLDRARLEAQAPAGRPVRLREDERNVVPSRNQGREGPFCEVGCSGEN